MVVLQRLGKVVGGRGLDVLAGRLEELAGLAAEDLATVEADLSRLPKSGSLVVESAGHLLGLNGKRLRPMCVALAARVGQGFGPAARACAVAAELVHNATLLHDDVLDLGDVRRGAPTSRALYGNAASVLAGDWLLTEALRRVRGAADGEVFDQLLDTIGRMIFAESVQLERRGRVDRDRASYLQVVEGKTAALFRWALFAGARAGGLTPDACSALELYGLELGVAFQLVDDLLDFSGAEAPTGKSPFADLREGKMTWPLLLGLERDPALEATLQRVLDEPEAAPAWETVRIQLAALGTLDDTRALAREHVERAIRALQAVPDSTATRALGTVAHAALERRS